MWMKSEPQMDPQLLQKQMKKSTTLIVVRQENSIQQTFKSAHIAQTDNVTNHATQRNLF